MKNLTAALLLLAATTLHGQDAVCKLSAASGDVRFIPGSGAERPVVVGMTLAEKDILVTGPASWAVLTFRNGTVMRLEADGRLELRKLSENRRSLRAELRIPEAGKLLAAVRKSGRQDSRFDVHVATAVVGVRGTDFSAQAFDKDRGTIALFSGKIIVRDFSAEAGLSGSDAGLMLDFLREVVLGPGQAVDVMRGKGLTKPRPLGAEAEQDRKTLQALAANPPTTEGDPQELRRRALQP